MKDIFTLRNKMLLVLAAVMVIVFVFRMGSFKKKHPFTYDETVYATVAAQIKVDPANYNTQSLYRAALKKGRKLPDYFNKPLFKHPPLFAQLISVGYDLGGRTYYSAFKVSLLFGVLLIGLTFFLGEVLFDKKVGMYAALLMVVEPIVWICSQKIWMETTLAFFTVLALYLFARSIKKEDRFSAHFMIASGVAAGLATLTKYPGILATVVIFVYSVCCKRGLFRKKAFLFSLVIPFIMLLPWIQWNYRVYGAEFLNANVQIIKFTVVSKAFLGRYWFLLIAVAILGISIFSFKKFFSELYEKIVRPKTLVMQVSIVSIILIGGAVLLRSYILNALSFAYVPETGWYVGMLKGEPPYFYFGRLIELMPFFIFSYLGLCLLALDRENAKEYFYLFLSVFIIIAFYILWKNYQCRYITAVTAPMLVLSARTQMYLVKKIKEMPSKMYRNIGLGIFAGLLLYFMFKTLLVDMILAVPNTACYF